MRSRPANLIRSPQSRHDGAVTCKRSQNSNCCGIPGLEKRETWGTRRNISLAPLDSTRHDVTGRKGLQAKLEQGWQFHNCLHTEQF
jgi:hypothetical protein